MHNKQHLIARRLDYTWIDASRKQVKLPAPTYIDYVMSWVQQTIDNGRDFPTKRTKDNSQILHSYFFYILTDQHPSFLVYIKKNSWSRFSAKLPHCGQTNL